MRLRVCPEFSGIPVAAVGCGMGAIQNTTVHFASTCWHDAYAAYRLAAFMSAPARRCPGPVNTRMETIPGIAQKFGICMEQTAILNARGGSPASGQLGPIPPSGLHGGTVQMHMMGPPRRGRGKIVLDKPPIPCLACSACSSDALASSLRSSPNWPACTCARLGGRVHESACASDCTLSGMKRVSQCSNCD